MALQPNASFVQFIKEKQYLANVTPATVEWYKHSLKWLRSDSPSKADLQDAVMRMREKGLKATGCNSAIRAINAYLHWHAKGPEVKCGIGCQHLRVAYLKEPELVLPTFTLPQVSLLTKYKPKNEAQHRLHIVLLTLLDTGCRIDEILSLRAGDVDMDSLLLCVTGKGRKQRRIPFSFQLRKILVRYMEGDGLLFHTRDGKKLGRRNVLRDAKALCKRLGFVPPARTLHSCRHYAEFRNMPNDRAMAAA
jgi:integrase/recombinase XerD